MTQKKIGIIAAILVLLGFSLYYFAVPRMSVKERLEEIRMLASLHKDCASALPKAEKLAKQNPSLGEAWRWAGMCEAQIGDKEEAKTYLERALSLDAGDKAAQTYLDLLGKGSFTETVSYTRADFESKLGFTVDPAFGFVRAYAFPPDPGSAEIISANYISSMSASAAVRYFSSVLTDTGFSVEESDNEGDIALFGTKGKMNVNVNVSKGLQVRVAVLYSVSK